jgi:outer membrane protein TolC
MIPGTSMPRAAGFILIFLVYFAGPRPVSAGPVLTLGDYLGQVERSNNGYRGLQLNRTGAELSSHVASLLFAPQAFTDFKVIYDPRDSHSPGIEGDTQVQRQFSVGLRQQTSFGLQLQLALDIDQGTLIGTDPALVPKPSISNTYVVPTYSLSLWQNFGGRADRANQRMTEAQSLATSYGNAYGAQGLLVQAEGAYWRLASLREAIRLIKESLERARSILALDTQKSRRRLIDSSDLLLSQAAAQGKELELTAMQDEERSAASAFNTARGVESEIVADELPLPSIGEIAALKAPERRGPRGDIRAAEQEAIAAESGQEMAREKLLPNLNLFGSIFAAGVAFSIPLDQSATQDARLGYARQGEAARASFEHKIFVEKGDWEDLIRKFAEAKRRLELASRLEEIQRKKYEDIRSRRSRGLTIAYQVFQYELDYLSAARDRIQAAGQVLGLNAQFKLYSQSGGP